MTEAEALDIEAMYVVANTPAYLYRHLRANDAVRRLARDSTAKQLAEMFRELLSKPEHRASDVAQAYAIMTAMSLRDYTEWRGPLEGLDVQALDWGEHFRKLLQQRATPTLVTSLTMPRARIATFDQASASNTSTEITVRPQIVITDDSR